MDDYLTDQDRYQGFPKEAVLTEYIIYVTSGGGRIDVETEDVASAVAEALRQESEAGREGLASGLSYYDAGIRQYVSADHLLNGVPGTTVSEVK